MRRLKRTILLILILSMSITTSVSATTIDDIKKQKEETQKQLDAANEDISELTEVRKGITDEIEQIDDELVEVMTSISILEDEIADIEDQIEVKKGELEEAIRIKDEQYEAMKARIKFMYEKGDATYAQLLFEARTMGDLVNKAEYIDEMYTYDRQKLAEYIAAMEAVEAAKTALSRITGRTTNASPDALRRSKRWSGVWMRRKDERTGRSAPALGQHRETAAFARQAGGFYRSDCRHPTDNGRTD